jgi:hypothetical protein
VSLLFPGLLRGRSESGGTFDALSFGSPLWAMWAEDPGMEWPGDGTPVASWRNGGSLSGDWAQATAEQQPVWLSAGASGKPALQFVSEDSQTLVAGGAWGVAAADLTVVVVTRVTAAGGVPAAAYAADFDGYAFVQAQAEPDSWAGIASGMDAGVAADINALGVVEFRVPAVGAIALAVNGGTFGDGLSDVPQPFDAASIGSAADFAYHLDGVVAFAAAYPTATAPAGLVAGLINHYGT